MRCPNEVFVRLGLHLISYDFQSIRREPTDAILALCHRQIGLKEVNGIAVCLDLSTLCSIHVVVRPFEKVAKQVHGMWAVSQGSAEYS